MNLATLNDWFDVSLDLGTIRWRKRSSNRVKIGDLAGHMTGSGYILLSLFDVDYYVSHLIWLAATGSMPKEQIDHKNGCRSDNRIVNLAAVTNAENAKNMAKKANNTSGVTGVYYDKRLKKWLAHITVDGRKLHLGAFFTKEAAVAVREGASRQFGYSARHGK